MSNNIKKFPTKRATETLPESCTNTESYILSDVLFTNAPKKTITDFTTGDQRNRRWGMSIAMGVIPGLDQVPVDGPVILPNVPTRFFTADTIEDLRARLMYEIDKALDMAKMSVEQPEEFAKKHTELLQQLAEGHTDDMN
jgi:hypothetical protein